MSTVLPSITSPKSVNNESSGSSNSKFKNLKKKIRNKFRLARSEDVKTLAQAMDTLKRSDELLISSPPGGSKELKNEFKELKDTLASIINQNQILSEVVKTVDSACPDPFKEPEKFSVYFAHRSFSSNRSLSEEEFDFEAIDMEKDQAKEQEKEKEIVNEEALTVEFNSNANVGTDSDVKVVEISGLDDMKNALLRLQNLRLEEQRVFQVERENYESRLEQIVFLQQEIEILSKRNSEHQIQLEFMTQNNNKNNINNENSEDENENVIDKLNFENLKIEIENLKIENEQLKQNLVQSEFNKQKQKQNQEQEQEEAALADLNQTNQQSQNTEITAENNQLKHQLELTLIQLKSLQEITESQVEKDRQFREISEENVRLKIEFEEIQKELNDTERQLCDLEKEPVTSIISLENEAKNFDESAFKYVYLSNLVLKFMQVPEQRPELAQIIMTTLKTDQAHFQQAMSMNHK